MKNIKVAQLLDQKKLSPLVINYQFTNFQEKYIAFQQLYLNYQLILKARDAGETIERLLKITDITQLQNFYENQEGLKVIHRRQIQALNIMYFKIIGQIIKTLFTYQKYAILSKIIQQNYYFINRYPKSISGHRTVAFAIFAYLEMLTVTYYDWKQMDLMMLFRQKLNENFIKNIYLLLEKLLDLAQFSKYLQYKQFTIDDCLSIGLRNVMVSIDHIYARILLMIIIQFENSLSGQAFPPIENFITDREEAIESINYSLQKDQMYQTQYLSNTKFYEIFLMLNNWLILSQSSICETFASSLADLNVFYSFFIFLFK